MTSTPTDAGAPPAPTGELALNQACFVATAEVRAGMDPDTLPPYGIEANHASGKAIFAAEACAPFRPVLLVMPTFDIGDLDGLPTLARGLLFVHTEIRRQLDVEKLVPKLALEGYEKRRLMLDYADVLSRKDTVDPELVARVREGSGHLDLIEDLNVLTMELDALPEALVGEQTAVTREDLRRASELAHELSVRIGTEAKIDLTLQQLHLERRKLAALLLASHKELHAAMTFLRRREGDVDTLVPSLYVVGVRKTEPRSKEEAVNEHLAELHAQLHAQSAPPLDPEDNPFVTEE